MKTRWFVLALILIFLVCIGLSLVLLNPGAPAGFAEIRSGGVLVCTVDLAVDQSFCVTAPDGGENVITVHDGAIAVTAATCPDHYCMARGYCRSGAQIVCLPNRLTITFLGSAEVDAAAG